MKRVLALLHIWDDPAGYVGELLEEHGIAFDIVKVEAEPIPDFTQYDAIVVFGGPQNANEDDKYPYFVPEKVMIRKAVEQEIPFLGICLGGQLLATVLGGEVKRHTLTEIGFSNVRFTEEGKSDPLYARLPGYQTVYQWHEDIFEIPPGAVRLATSEKTENQAFRYGRNAYGLQYHIELTPEMLNTWLHEPSLKNGLINVIGSDEYDRIEHEPAAFYSVYRSHTCVMFENFLRVARLI